MADALLDVLSNFPLKDQTVLEQLWTAFASLFENLTVNTENDHGE